jgi:hypothetical protein
MCLLLCSKLLGLCTLPAGGGNVSGGVTYKRLLPQVFISHTGQDSDARTFAASILYPALLAAGVHVFIDHEDVGGGSKWEADLERAAESRVVVVVLSKSYQYRFWCMRELHLACRAQDTLDNQLTIIPVFYHHENTVLQTEGVLQRWGPEGDLYQKQSTARQAKINAAHWADNFAGVAGRGAPIFRRQEGQSPAKDEGRRVALEIVNTCMGCLPPEQDVDAVGYEDQLARVAIQLGDEAEGSRLGVWLSKP